MAGQQVDTNDIQLAWTDEPGFGEAIVGNQNWNKTTPNEIGEFGGTITAIQRNPISPDRQALKGLIADVDATVSFTSDLTISEIDAWAPRFCLSGWQGFETIENVSATAGKFSIGAGKTWAPSWNMKNAILWVTGFNNEANNGLKYVAVAVTGNREIAVRPIRNSGVVVAEAGGAGTVEIVGYVGEEDKIAALNIGGLTIIDPNARPAGTGDAGWSQLGLLQGMWCYIGGDSSDAILQNNDPNNGWHKISGVTATNLLFEGNPAGINGSGNGAFLEIYFGRRVHNVATNSNEFERKFIRFENIYKGLGANNVDAYEYVIGAAPNALTIAMPLSEKVTSQTAFVAKQALELTEAQQNSDGTRVDSLFNKAFNTSADFARLAIVGETGDDVSTYIKSVDLTITNNFAAEKCLASLGAAFMNLGSLEVSGSIQALFTDVAMANAVANNSTLRLRSILTNDDGSIMLELPSVTMGGGGKEFTLNETVKINLDPTSFKDDIYGDSINICRFAYLPEVAK